jgi:hypothetical protein
VHPRSCSIAFGVLVLATGAPAHADCDGSPVADIISGVLDALSHSSSSSSSNTSTGVAEAACVDANGYTVECEPSKSTSTVVLEVGTAMRSFTSPLGTRNATVEHEHQSFAYRAIGPSASSDTALVAQLRIAVGLRYGFYLGGEAEGGVLTARNAAAEMMSSGDHGTPAITPGSVSTFGGLAIAGFHHRLGPVDLGLEAAGGFRAVAYEFTSQYYACVTSDSVIVGMPVLEGRARGAVWVSPTVSVGVTYGRSVVDDSSVGGLYLHWNPNESAGR